MNRLLSCVLAIVLGLCIFTVNAGAAENSMEIIYLDDGSYLTVETVTNGIRAAWSVTGNKVYTHYSASGSSNWKVVLTGSFTYTGSSATCTSSSVDVTIYDSSWYVIYKCASKSGNAANGSVTMGDKLDGETITKVPVDLTLSCDANGNLS